MKMNMKFYIFTFLICLLCLVATEEEEIEEWDYLKKLFSITGVGGARFHPFKEEIIFASNKPGVAQVFTAKFDRKLGKLTSKPRRLIETKNRVTSPRFLHNGNILYLHDRGGNENFQIGLYKPESKTSFWVTEDYTTRNLINVVTKNYLYFTSNMRNKKKFELFRRKRPLDQPSEIEHLYTPTRGVVSLSLINSDETKFVLNVHYSNMDNELVLFNLADKSTIHLTKQLTKEKPARWVALQWINKEKSKMLVKTDYNGDFLRVAILSWPNKDLTSTPEFVTIPFMESINHDVISLNSNKFKEYFIEINDNGYSRIIKAKFENENFIEPVEVSLPLKKSVIVHGDARSWGKGWSISKDSKLMIATLNNAQTPRDIYVMNLSNDPEIKSFWRVMKKQTLPEILRHETFIREQLQTFKSFDGLSVPYFIYRPKGKIPTKGWPCIIKLHGGPESQARPNFSPLVQLLVKSGYVVVEPNIRGSRGYGKKYLNLDNQDKRLDAIKDIKYLALHLSQFTFINSKRLVVMGGSYGGYATLMAVTQYPSLWKAGVDVVGMSNLVTFLEHTSKWRRKLREPEYGSLETQREMLEGISPINYVYRVRCPVFIIQGDNDPRVPLQEAVQMYEKLQEVGFERPKVAKSKLLRFADEGHGFSKKENRLKAYKSLLKWLKKNV